MDTHDSREKLSSHTSLIGDAGMVIIFNKNRYAQPILVLCLFVFIFSFTAQAQDHRNIKKRRVAPYTNVQCGAEYNKCNFINALKLSEAVVFFMHHNNTFTKDNVIDKDSVKFFQDHVNLHDLGVSAFNQGGFHLYLDVTTPKTRRIQSSLYACDIYMHYANCLHAVGYIDRSHNTYTQLYSYIRDSRGFDCSRFSILAYQGECASLLGRFDEAEDCYDLDLKNNELYNDYMITRLSYSNKDADSFIIHDAYQHDRMDILGKAILKMYAGDIQSSEKNINIFEKKI